jgi:hypothetical protein
MATAVDAVVDALVAAFTAALPGVEVADGPPVEAPGVPDLVLVAHDQTPDGDSTITIEQEWADLAASSRYERGQIPCCVVAQTGDVDIAGRRARAVQLLAACEAALRSDRTLGGSVMTAQFASGAVHQIQNDEGSAVVGAFQITYMAQV